MTAAPKKILCPIDFSSGARQAMRTAVRIAKHTDADLVIVHSWYIPPMTLNSDYIASAFIQDLHDDAEDALVAARREAEELGAPRVTTALLIGPAWDQIVHTLDKDPDFGLCVIGTHGRSGVARIMLGSVAEKVVRHAPCPVLAVRPDNPPEPYRHVLCPVDFSATAHDAVLLAMALAQPGPAELTLLHAVELPLRYASESAAVGFVRQVVEDSAARLDQWARELPRVGDVKVTFRTRIGGAGAEVLATLEEDPSFDLVATGSHGRTGLRRLVIGSVAEKTVRHAHCPVLVAHRRPEPTG